MWKVNKCTIVLHIPKRWFRVINENLAKSSTLILKTELPSCFISTFVQCGMFYFSFRTLKAASRN